MLLYFLPLLHDKILYDDSWILVDSEKYVRDGYSVSAVIMNSEVHPQKKTEKAPHYNKEMTLHLWLHYFVKCRYEN